MKLLLISNYPTSYRVDFYNQLYKMCENGSNIKFIFIEDKSQHYKLISNYNAVFMKSAHNWKDNKFKNILLLSLFIFKFKPDVIIVGGLNFYTLILVFIKYMLKYKVYIWWGVTVPLDFRGSFKNLCKRIFISLMRKGIDGGLFYSSLAKDNLCQLFPELKKTFILGNNTRDSKKLNQLSKQFSINRSKNIRIITIGFQEKRKNTIVLLEASKILKNRGVKDFVIDVVGDGTLLSSLKEFSKKEELPVCFHGQVSPEDSIRLLSQADILVHPSLRDYWPQVYTEALCCGKAMLISKSSGVSDNFIEAFGSIVLFDANNPVELADKLGKLLINKELRTLLSEKAFEAASNCDAISQTPKLLNFLKYKN